MPVGKAIEGSGLDVNARTSLHELAKSLATNSYRIIVPFEINADQDDYFPNDWGNADTVILSASAPFNINGFKAGKNGDKKVLINGSAPTITLVHAATTSVTFNRIYGSGAANLLLLDGAMANIFYDGLIQRWRAQ